LGHKSHGLRFFDKRRENVKQQARRLSYLSSGAECITMIQPGSSPNIFGHSKQADTKTLNPLMLEKLDW